MIIRWICLVGLACVLGAHAGEIHEAAAAGDLPRVRSLLRANPASANARDRGTFPLHEAARKGHLEVVQALLEAGADLNARDANGITPLRLAAAYQHTRLADWLRQKGALDSARMPAKGPGVPSTATPPGPAVAVAPARTPVNPTPKATASNAPVYIVPRPGATNGQAVSREMLPVLYPIHEAVRVGDLAQVTLLLKSWPELAEATDEKEYRPLHVAAESRQLAVAQLLLARGANPNAKSKMHLAPLHIAAQKWDPELVALLLQHRADPNVLTLFQDTPLLLAAKGDKTEAVFAGLLLASTGGNPPVSTNLTAPGQIEVVKRLLAARANVNARNQGGSTSLMIATVLDNRSLAQLLIEHGAEVNVTDPNSGMAPLHLAAAQGHATLVQLLASKRAEINLRDRRGDTPLCYALRAGHDQTAAVLKQFGGSAAPPRPFTAQEQSLVDYYIKIDATFQKGTPAERRKAAQAMIPTKADVDRMFPVHARNAWKVVEEMQREIKAALDETGRAPEPGAIWRVLPEPASPVVQQLQARNWIAADLPILSLRVNRRGAADVVGGYCLVNGRWIPLPPLNRIFTE